MEYEVQTEFQGPGFVAVPNHVAQVGLSAEALGVLVYLASQPQGWVARPCTIQERFAIGRDKWQRIARELREAGAMDLRVIRGAGGRALGKRMVVRWPEQAPASAPSDTENRETRFSDREPEKPTVGKPAKGYGQTRKKVPANPLRYKEEEKTLARGRAARPDEGPAASRADGRRPADRRQQQAATDGAAAPGSHRREFDSAGQRAGTAGRLALSRFVVEQLRTERHVVINGEWVEPGTPAFHAWRVAAGIEQAEAQGNG
jgi:hypothetical protein